LWIENYKTGGVMIKVTLYKGVNVRSGETPLRFRLRDGKDVDLALDTGIMVAAKDLLAFDQNGMVRAGEDANEEVKIQIERYLGLMSDVYLSMRQNGEVVTDESFKRAVDEYVRMEDGASREASERTLVGRFRKYLEEEYACGRFSENMYKESMTLSRKLERYLVIREHAGILPKDFTSEQVVDFEKFCIDEYLYAANPKYAALYPRGFDECRLWPKQKLQEEPLRKVLIHFQMFWKDLVSFGEIKASPYEDYVPWMKEKKRKQYFETMVDPLTLTMDEFQQVISTPVPESLADTRNAFILQVCIGLGAKEFKKLSMNNVAVSKEGIPYIYFQHEGKSWKDDADVKYGVEVPLVRIAYDIIMRTRFQFYFGRYNEAYNVKIHKFLRLCGITREVWVYNARIGDSELLPLCDVISQGNVHRTHMDLIHESEALRGMRGAWFTSVRTMARMRKIPMEDHFWNLNWAMGQKPYKVDENLNIIEGAPFVMEDPLIYEEQPNKLPGGRTNPYVISELIPVPAGEKDVERVELQYGVTLLRERKVEALEPVAEFLASLSEEHRKKVQYGVMLLKKLSDFKVSFVEACKDTIYLMTTALGWITYTTYFYQNGETIVLLKVFGEGQGRRTKASVTEKMPVVRELRWKHVIHEISGVDYDAVLDAEFGPTGTTKREVYEMRACRAYVSFAIKQARQASGIPVEEFEVKMGLKTGRSNLSNVERRSRVLPLDYLAKVMSSLGMRAVIVRPGLVNWNPISRTHTLEQMLEEIGEPVYRWKRKEPDK